MGGDQPMARGAASAQQQADHGDRAVACLGRPWGGASGGVSVPAAGGNAGRWRGWGGGQQGWGSCLVSATAVLGARAGAALAPATPRTNHQLRRHGRPGAARLGRHTAEPQGPWRVAAWRYFVGGQGAVHYGMSFMDVYSRRPLLEHGEGLGRRWGRGTGG